jgi:hypothetical protein
MHRIVSSFVLIGAVALLPLAVISSAGESEGLVMQNGKMMVLHEGKPAEVLDHPMTLSSGDTVNPDGKVVTKSGKQMQMHDGTIIMDSGHVMHGSHAKPMMPPDESFQDH